MYYGMTETYKMKALEARIKELEEKVEELKEMLELVYSEE